MYGNQRPPTSFLQNNEQNAPVSPNQVIQGRSPVIRNDRIQFLLESVFSLVDRAERMLQARTEPFDVSLLDTIVLKLKNMKNLSIQTENTENVNDVYELEDDDVGDRVAGKLFISLRKRLMRRRKNTRQDSPRNMQAFEIIKRIDRNMIPQPRKSSKIDHKSKEWFILYSSYLLKLFRYNIPITTLMISFLSDRNSVSNYVFRCVAKRRTYVKGRAIRGNIEYDKGEYVFAQWVAKIQSNQVHTIYHTTSLPNHRVHYGPANFKIGVASIRRSIINDFSLKIYNGVENLAIFGGASEIGKIICEYVVKTEETILEKRRTQDGSVQSQRDRLRVVCKNFIDGAAGGLTTYKIAPLSKLIGCNNRKIVINFASTSLKEKRFISLEDQFISSIRDFNCLRKVRVDVRVADFINVWMNDFKMWKILFIRDPDYKKMNEVIKCWCSCAILSEYDCNEDSNWNCFNLLKLLNVSKEFYQNKERIISLHRKIKKNVGKNEVVFGTIDWRRVLGFYNLRRVSERITLEDLNCVEPDVLKCLYCYCNSVTIRMKYFFPRLKCWFIRRRNSKFKFDIKNEQTLSDIVHEEERVMDSAMEPTFGEKAGDLKRNGRMVTFKKFWNNVSPNYLREKMDTTGLRYVGPLRVKFEQKRESSEEVMEWGMISAHDYVLIRRAHEVWLPIVLQPTKDDDNNLILNMSSNNHENDNIVKLWSVLNDYFEMKRDPNSLEKYTSTERFEMALSVIYEFRPLIKSIIAPPEYVANVIHTNQQLSQAKKLGFSLLDLSSQNMEGDNKQCVESFQRSFNSNNFYNEHVTVCTDSLSEYVRNEAIRKEKYVKSIALDIKQVNEMKGLVVPRYVSSTLMLLSQKLRKYATRVEEKEYFRIVKNLDPLLSDFQKKLDMEFPIVRDLVSFSKSEQFLEREEELVREVYSRIEKCLDDIDPYKRTEYAEEYKKSYKFDKTTIAKSIIKECITVWVMDLNGLRDKSIDDIEKSRRRKIDVSVKVQIEEELKRKTGKYLSEES